jgi:Bifunctional DNA primase/polymerase, N-terminal
MTPATTTLVPTTFLALDTELQSPLPSGSKSQPDFVSIATDLVQQGFRVTPVHPETKMGVMKNWQKFQITTVDDVQTFAKYYPHHNVGVVAKRGVGRHMFLDIDADGVAERIEAESGQKLPLTYTVQSRPQSRPYKRHYYFLQTDYSFRAFGRWHSVNANIKDLTTLDEKGRHPTLYDVKGVGGGSLVVGAGSVRDTGEVYTVLHDEPVAPIPDWLTDWLVQDIEKYWNAKDKLNAEKRAAKDAERSQYTPKKRASMRAQNLSQGFDVFFEDIYEFLRWRAFHHAKHGVGRSTRHTLESVLIDDAKNFVVGGRAYMATPEGQSLITKLANDPGLEFGDASFFYRRKSRPRKSSGLVFHYRETRREAMAKIIKRFPCRLNRTEAYDKLADGLNGHFPFDRRSKVDQTEAGRARRDAGFGLDGNWWVRRPD